MLFFVNSSIFFVFFYQHIDFFCYFAPKYKSKIHFKNTKQYIMRALKQYGGSILILIVVVVLAISFYTEALQDASLNTVILAVCFVLVVAGVLLNIFGGKSADKIGGGK